MQRQDVRTRIGTAVVAGALSLLAYAALVAPAAAQTLWTGPQATAQGRPSVQLEMLRPDFTEPTVGFVGATYAGFVTARVPVGRGWTVVADLPFSRAAWEIEDETGSSRLTGNPYIGAELRASKRITAELGVRIPTGELDEDNEPTADVLGAMLVGMAGELERLEAFAPQTLGFYAAASYAAPLRGPLSFRVRGNSTLVGGDGTPENLLLGYTGQLWYEAGRADVGAGITGRANVTDDDEDADRASHQLIAAGGYRLGRDGRVRPGVQLRLPLDGTARELTGVTVGFSLGYAFR